MTYIMVFIIIHVFGFFSLSACIMMDIMVFMMIHLFGFLSKDGIACGPAMFGRLGAENNGPSYTQSTLYS